MAILDLRMNTMLIDILPDLAPEAAATVRGLIKPAKNRMVVCPFFIGLIRLFVAFLLNDAPDFDVLPH